MIKNNRKKEITLCESSFNKMISNAIYQVLKEEQIEERELASDEKFTPYPEGNGPKTFKKAFYNGNAESRNPAYAEALKNKKKLDEAITNAIRKVIKEDYDTDQLNLWKTVQQYLEKIGYPTWGGYRNNPYILKVSIKDFSDISKIRATLVQLLGIDPIELTINNESNLTGHDERAVIYLPSVNKTKFAQKYA